MLWRKEIILLHNWEKINGFHDDPMAYFEDRCCYDCRRHFDSLKGEMICGQMLLDGVKDASVDNNTTCNIFFSDLYPAQEEK
jgi:hypothetical protein